MARRKRRPSSEYGRELMEKQELRNTYGLREKQFSNYVKEIMKKRTKVEDTSLALLRRLEERLDNIIYRAGFATSRPQARQLVSHAHFLVNGKPVNIPSFKVQKGDKILLKDTKKDKTYYKRIELVLKKHTPPKWLKLDKKNFSVEMLREPTFED